MSARYVPGYGGTIVEEEPASHGGSWLIAFFVFFIFIIVIIAVAWAILNPNSNALNKDNGGGGSWWIVGGLVFFVLIIILLVVAFAWGSR